MAKLQYVPHEVGSTGFKICTTDFLSLTQENFGFHCITYVENLCSELRSHLLSHMGTQVSLSIFIQSVLHTKTCCKGTASPADYKEQQAACSRVPVSTLFEVILSWSIYKTATMYSQGKSYVLLILLLLKGHFSRMKWPLTFPFHFSVVLCAEMLSHCHSTYGQDVAENVACPP